MEITVDRRCGDESDSSASQPSGGRRKKADRERGFAISWNSRFGGIDDSEAARVRSDPLEEQDLQGDLAEVSDQKIPVDRSRSRRYLAKIGMVPAAGSRVPVVDSSSIPGNLDQLPYSWCNHEESEGNRREAHLEREERAQDEHDRTVCYEGAAGEARVKENPEGLCSTILRERALGIPASVKRDSVRGRARILLFTSFPHYPQLCCGAPRLPINLGKDAHLDVATMSSFYAAHGLSLSRFGETDLRCAVSKDRG